jgi:hypothetical protein
MSDHIINAIANALDPTQGRNPQHRSLIEALAVALVLLGHDPTNYEVRYDVSKMKSYLQPKEMSHGTNRDYNKLDMARPEIKYGFGLPEVCGARHPIHNRVECELKAPHWAVYHSWGDEGGVHFHWPRQYNEYLEFNRTNNGQKYRPATKSSQIK